VEILRSGPKAWNAWREKNPSTVPDLACIALKASERQMGPINGGPINLKSACLQDAGLRFATLSAADLEAANMSGADLAHARLNQANLSAANLSNALLDHADFAGANLTKVNLCGASLRSATLSTADLEAADMSGADLLHARLNQANLSAANLSNALLDHADFASANLTKVNLCGASLRHAKNLTQSQLEETIGSDSTILPPHLRGSVSWSVDRSQTETTALERRDLRPRARHTADVDVPPISSYNRPVWIVAVLLIGGALVTTGLVWQHMSLDTSGAQRPSGQSLIEPKPNRDTGDQGLQPSAPEALMEANAAAELRPSADAEIPSSAASAVDRTEAVPVGTSGAQRASGQSLTEPKPGRNTGDQGLQPSAPETLMEAKAAAELRPSADAEIPSSVASTVNRNEAVPFDTSGAQRASEQSLTEPKPSLDNGEQRLQSSAPEALTEAKAAAEPRPSADAEIPSSAASTVDRTESAEQRPALEKGGGTVPQETKADAELQASDGEKRSTEAFGPNEHAPGSPKEGLESKSNEASEAPPLVSAESPESISRQGTVPDLPNEAFIPDPQLTSATQASPEALALTSPEHSSPPSLSDTLPRPVVTAPLPSSVGQRDAHMVLPRDTGTPPMPVGDPARLSVAATNAAAEEPTTPPQDGVRWSEFQSPERGFAVSFPGTPQATSGAVAGLNPLVRYSFQANEGDDTVYTVVVLDYPAGKAPNLPDPDLYAKMVSAYAKDSQSRVRKKGPATIADREGFEAITDDAKAKVDHLVDIVPTGDRIYMLISAGPKGHAASDDAARFRDSLRLTGDRSQSAARLAPSP